MTINDSSLSREKIKDILISHLSTEKYKNIPLAKDKKDINLDDCFEDLVLLIKNDFKLDHGTCFDFLFNESINDDKRLNLIKLICEDNNITCNTNVKFLEDVYKKSVCNIARDDKYYPLFSKYINLIENKKSDDFIKDIWSNTRFQGNILESFNKKDATLIKNIIPKNINWGTCLYNDFLAKYPNKNMISEDTVKLLDVIDHLPNLKDCYDNVIIRLRKNQELFFELLSKPYAHTLGYLSISSGNPSVCSPQKTYFHSQKYHVLGWDVSGPIHLSGVLYFDKDKNPIYFTPSNIIEVLIMQNATAYLDLLENQDARDMIKSSLSKIPILTPWILQSSKSTINKVLSKIDMQDFKDKHGNNIMHYLLSLSNIFNSTSDYDIYDYEKMIKNNAKLFSSKNNLGVSPFDIYKKFHSKDMEDEAVFEKLIISASVSNNNNKLKIPKKI